MTMEFLAVTNGGVIALFILKEVFEFVRGGKIGKNGNGKDSGLVAEIHKIAQIQYADTQRAIEQSKRTSYQVNRLYEWNLENAKALVENAEKQRGLLEEILKELQRRKL